MAKAWRWIVIQFTRHELWAISWSLKEPTLALFLFASVLWLWTIFPVLVMFVSISAFDSANLIVGSIVTPVWFGAVIPWGFRWFRLCFGLFASRRGMAEKKKAELIVRLERLKNLSS